MASLEVHDRLARVANDHIASICGSVPHVGHWAWLETLTNLRREIGSISWTGPAFTIGVDGVFNRALIASVRE